ncbi:hypothetical protein [Thauera butanivorans]|uniref:hypothetical protein n=1 Tax=Thauera butanivorans TaxID=86174 RepID=UPI0009FD01AF|nr:hypothetical protein [Thauera butanivorans]
MNNDITALRSVLFDTLQRLNDPENPMPVDRAKAVGEISQTIINTAKVELEHMRITRGRGTGFMGALPAPEEPTALAERDDAMLPGAATTSPTAHGTKTVTQAPGATVTRHVMR